MRPLRKGAMQTEANKVSGLQQLQHAAALRLLVAERLSNDLAAFVKKAWSILHPTRPMVWSWHYELICEYLTAIHQRKLTRLILNVPPRTAKSTIAQYVFRAGCGRPIRNTTSFRLVTPWICRPSTRSYAATCYRVDGIGGCGATNSGSLVIATKSASS